MAKPWIRFLLLPIFVSLLTSCGPYGDQGTTTVFSIEDVQQLRTTANAARQSAGTPYIAPDGWSKSTYDPMALMSAFPTLHLKEGFVLRAYLFRAEIGGNGIIWAMPVEAAFPDPKDLPIVKNTGSKLDRMEGAPKPDQAQPIMNVIEGDGSPWSYLSASILSREAQEYGAWWHGLEWSAEYILGADPWNTRSYDCSIYEACSTDESKWTWMESKPNDWRPRATVEDGTVTVTFYSQTAAYGFRIFRNIDAYSPGSYNPVSRKEEIANAPGGFAY